MRQGCKKKGKEPHGRLALNGLFKLGDLAYKLGGSRKYPYPPPPPPRKTIGNSEWEGGFKGSNFQGVRGVHGKLFSKG